MGERCKVTKLETQKRDKTTGMEEIKRKNTYFKNTYSTRFKNIKEIDNFLDRYYLPKLNQEQVSR